MCNLSGIRWTSYIPDAEKSFREACIIALSETWLNDSELPDEEVSLDNFTIIRVDRTIDSGNERGGGVCVYINNRWCNNIKIHNRVCTPDIEMLTLSLRPYYLPREFPTVVISCVYIPPGVNTNMAAELAAKNVHTMLSKYPDTPVLIMGDFNSCKLDCVLPSFEQCVDVPTRREKVLDLCYGNINNAYTARVQPPIGAADHNIVFLLPQHTQLLKRALHCRRHGGGLLLQIVCLLILFVMSLLMSPFYVGVQWTQCARRTLKVTRALNRVFYTCGVRRKGMERIALAWLILHGRFI